MTRVWPFARLAIAALCLASMIQQLINLVANAQQLWPGQVSTAVANFFSYFTILSNIGAVITLTLGAVWLLRTRGSREHEPAWLATLFVCVSTYMIITGVVYNLLLRSAAETGDWTNEAVHLIGPAFMLVDALVAPRRRTLPWKTLAVAVAFPILWAIYTLIRANLVTSLLTGDPWWYPYPFLDPHLVPGGYLGVSGYIVGIAAAVVGIAALVIRVRRSPAEPVSA